MAGPLDLNFGNYIETGGASDFGATGTTGATGITTTTRAGSSSGAGITSSQLQGIGMDANADFYNVFVNVSSWFT